MNEKIGWAIQFINSTASHIFMTGKAGTGKTTFLHQLAENTHKRFVVVAPTGIAALNAKGVTIHSQFLLPLGSFIPERNAMSEAGFYTQSLLARRNPLNSVRKQILRDVDLLVIDEVSMLRADILDAVDYRLRAVNGNFRVPFGGVQILMIGDLFQLPPVVKEREWSVMRQYYPSMYFFEARALQNGFTTIELDKIFRQKDDRFISILNNLRHDICTREDIETLNACYSEEKPEEEVITITTHNYRADRYNRQALEALPGASFFYEAEIEGDFPENIYPLPQKLELKEGAQVMFIKNDTLENKFYNGKLATVKRLDRKEITVSMAGTGEEYTLQQMKWENIRYTMNEETRESEDEIIGTFQHYPVKLAWAITVHKSQGLTFEKAVLDLGRAFASGQVYVALSRLRSLDGLILRTRINESAISNDEEINRFSQSVETQPPLEEQLQRAQRDYLQAMLEATFDLEKIIKQMEYARTKGRKKAFGDEEMQKALPALQESFSSEINTTVKFRRQLEWLTKKRDIKRLEVRIEKGSEYYLEFLWEKLKELLVHLEEAGRVSRTKTYRNVLSEIDQMIMKKMADLEKAVFLTRHIIQGKEIPDQEAIDEKRQQKRQELLDEVKKLVDDNPKEVFKKKKGKLRKGETYLRSYAMLHEGLSIEEIAEKRGLSKGTIESHMVKGIKNGKVEIQEVLPVEKVQQIKAGFIDGPDVNLTEVYKTFNGNFSYGILSMVRAHIQRNNGESYE